MKTITTAMLSACLIFAANASFSMPKDGMMKKDMTMQDCKDHMAMQKKDGMTKDDAMMKKDQMCADMMKKDGMKNDGMKHDGMKSDGMKNGDMKKDGMMKGGSASAPMTK